MTQNITFAGIFATHRNATTAITFSFEDFKVEPVTTAALSLNAADNSNFSIAQENFSSSAIVNNSLGTNNNFEKPKVYPNPLQKRFTLELPGTYEGIFTLQIVDQLGKIYEIGTTHRLKAGVAGMEVNISLLHLKSGIYSLRIHSDTRKTETIKLIIQ